MKSANKNTKSIIFTKYFGAKLEKQALKNGYSSPEKYVQYLVNAQESASKPKSTAFKRTKLNRLKSIHKTKKGQILCGDSLDWLHHPRNKNTVDLLITSPPFGLISKKSYGNESQEDYCAWFRQFAEGFFKVLKDD